MSGSIHAPRQITPRLKRVLRLLQVAGEDGATTREIVYRAEVCAVNSCIAELRVLLEPSGWRIDCDRKRPARYWLRRIEPNQQELF